MVELTYLSLKKTTFFVRIFDISPCVFTQISIRRARWMWNLIMHLTRTHTTYFWWTPLPQKHEIPEKMSWWCHHHDFSSISCFWDSGFHKKYAVWVLIGREIKLRIQRVLQLKIWVKTRGDMLKIQKKIVFFFLPSKLINFILLFYYFP